MPTSLPHTPKSQLPDEQRAGDNEQPPAGQKSRCAEAKAATAAALAPQAFFPGLVLEATAFTQKQLPHPQAPQVALAGRSNVGKSSLVNALAGRKSLAKVSATPGKTRSVNYYRVQGTEAFLVDLPGYGYARCSQEERNKWAALLRHYFCHTPGLRSFMLLVDARLQPQKADKDLLAYAAGLSLPVTVVLTKSDKCGKRDLAAVLRSWQALAGRDALLTCSARDKSGLKELGERILAILAESV